MKKFLLMVIFLMSLCISFIVDAHAQNTEYPISYNYESMFIGIYKPNDCNMTKDEWRTYYTSKFDEVYTDKYISSRDYDWYRTQNDTISSSHNCGPACISMALKWYDEDNNTTVNDIRNGLGYFDRGMSNLEVESYLSRANVPYNISSMSTTTIKESLKDGDIVLAILNINKTLKHIVVIYGTYVFEDVTYFVYYDPQGSDKEYHLYTFDEEVFDQNLYHCIFSEKELTAQLYTYWGLVIESPDKSIKCEEGGIIYGNLVS